MEIKQKIDELVKRYCDLQKKYHGDSVYSRRIEEEIDSLDCLMKKGIKQI